MSSTLAGSEPIYSAFRWRCHRLLNLTPPASSKLRKIANFQREVEQRHAPGWSLALPGGFPALRLLRRLLKLTPQAFEFLIYTIERLQHLFSLDPLTCGFARSSRWSARFRERL